MKQSLLSAPKAGIPLRGKKKKISCSDLKSHSEDLDASPQISSISDSVSTRVPIDLDEAESNYPIVPLLSENSSDQAVLPEFLNEASTSMATASCTEEIVQGGGSCMEEILMCSEKDVGEQNLEVELAGFSRAMEKLCDAIMEMLMFSVEQSKRRNGNKAVFFFPVMPGEMMLAFFVGAMLTFIILCLISNNLSDFNGPTPT